MIGMISDKNSIIQSLAVFAMFSHRKLSALFQYKPGEFQPYINLALRRHLA